MPITAILEIAEGGRFFANAARAAGVSEADARSTIARLAPAIAQKMKARAAADPASFDQLIALIEEGDASELQQDGALTDSDAHSDGAAILDDLYGSAAGAQSALQAETGRLDKLKGFALACISATAVLATLSAANAQSLSGGAAQAASTGSGGGGFFSILIAALLKGLLQGAQRQLAPKRRRRRYSSYTTRRRTTKRRKTTVGLDDIFRNILTGGK